MTMSKQDSKKDEQILDTLLPDIENMSREEAEALFTETGVDLRALRARLQDVAKGIAAKLRKGGTAASRSLTRAIEALDDSERLPQSSDTAAMAKAREIVRRFRKPQSIPEGGRIVRAARFSPTASAEHDDDSAERLAVELKKDVEGDDTPKE